MEVRSIKIEIAQTRDHRPVNDHRHGHITVRVSGELANTTRELRYGFAKKTAWFHSVVSDDHPDMEDVGYVQELHSEVITPELDEYGFSTRDSPPEWHYTDNDQDNILNEVN